MYPPRSLPRLFVCRQHRRHRSSRASLGNVLIPVQGRTEKLYYFVNNRHTPGRPDDSLILLDFDAAPSLGRFLPALIICLTTRSRRYICIICLVAIVVVFTIGLLRRTDGIFFLVVVVIVDVDVVRLLCRSFVITAVGKPMHRAVGEPLQSNGCNKEGH